MGQGQASPKAPGCVFIFTLIILNAISVLAVLKDETHTIQASCSLVNLVTVTKANTLLIPLSGNVKDMSISTDRKKLAVCGDFGIITYEVGNAITTLLTDLWEYTSALSSKTLMIFDDFGALGFLVVQQHSFVTDVAYYNINGLAIVTGFDNA